MYGTPLTKKSGKMLSRQPMRQEPPRRPTSLPLKKGVVGGMVPQKPIPVVKIKVGVAKPKVAKMSRGMERRMIKELDSGTKMMRKKDTSKIGSLKRKVF